MKPDGQQTAQHTNRRKGRQTKDHAHQKLPTYNREQNSHICLVLPEEDIHDGDPCDDIENAGTDSDSVVVHVHFVWFGGIGKVSELPPVAVLASDDEAVHSRYVLVFVMGGSGFCSIGPWEVFGLRVGDKCVASVGDDGGNVGIKSVVVKNHESRDGLEVE